MKTIFIATFISTLLFAGSVSAQENILCEGESQSFCTIFTTSTSSTGLLTIGGIVLTVVLVTKNNKSALRSYIDNNAVAVLRDTSLGGGETIADLRIILGVSEADHYAFAKWIRNGRRTISRMVSKQAKDEDYDGLIASAQLAFGG